MKNKLLVISHSYPPSNAPAAQRSFFLGKYLEETCSVGVLIVTPGVAVTMAGQSNWADAHNSRAVVQRTAYLPCASRLADSLWASSKIPSRKRIFRFSPKKIAKQLFRRLLIPDRGIVWYPYAVRTATQLIRSDPNISCVFTSSPSFSDHLAANRLKQKLGIKWIADFRDFHWIEAKENASTGFAARLNKRAERIVIERADACVFISESMREEYIERYPELKGRSHVIYNGYDPEEFLAPAPNCDKELTIFYSGAFYGGERCPKPLLKALDEMLTENEHGADKIKIQIAGSLDAESKNILNAFGSSKLIEYLGVIPRTEVLRRMSEADLLWLIVGSRKAHCYGFPVKGYEYIGAKRPILGFCPQGSEAEKVLKENGCELTFSSDSTSEQLKIHLRKYLNQKMVGKKIELEPTSTSERFKRKFHAEQLGKVIEGLTG